MANHPTSEPRLDKTTDEGWLRSMLHHQPCVCFRCQAVDSILHRLVALPVPSGPSREEVEAAMTVLEIAYSDHMEFGTDAAFETWQEARRALAALYRPAGESREVVDVDARADAIDGVVLAIANALSEAHIGEELGAEDADGPVWSGEGRAKLIFQARDLIAPLTIEHTKWVVDFCEADRARQLGVAEIVRQLLAEEISERKAVEMLTAAAPAGETRAGDTTQMRRFTVYRRGDLSATHNDQQAAPPDAPQYEGVVFSDGRVALRWLTPLRSVSVWDSLDDALGVHGHPEPRYGTEFVWHDAALPPSHAGEAK